ncbi:MAG: Abortive infection protein [Bacillota bacterium]|jgi:membrane protease YdiL (CAAX protease family)|nr:Abortive infection protein [Bacillota bacterium]
MLALITNISVNMFRYKKVNIKFNNIQSSGYSAIGAILLSIILTEVYNKQFTLNFPVNTILRLFIVRLLISIPIITAVILNKESLSSIGITKKNSIKSIILGFVIGLAYFFLTDIKSFKILNILTAQSIKALSHLFLYYMVVGLGEEVLYRGYLQTRLIHWFGEKKGWILASIIFAFMHLGQRMIINKMQISQAMLGCIALLPMSLLLGYTMLKTKNIISCSILHTFINFTSIIIGYIK